MKNKEKRQKIIDKVNISAAFSDQEKEWILKSLYIFAEMVERFHLKDDYIYKNIYLIKYPIKDAYGMVQPLIEGFDEIKSYRIYISDKYNFTEPELMAVFLHEMVHTIAKRDILRHNAITYRRAYKYILDRYCINILDIGLKEVDQHE